MPTCLTTSRIVFSLMCFAAVPALALDELPKGSAPPPLESPWFPSRMHAFVWRNWEWVDLQRMADVLGTTPDKVRAIGEEMGLPRHVPPTDVQRRRSYITVIRRNWHLLPYDQLLQLLQWTPEQLAQTLREDDFLWVKLGSLKPACAPLKYAEPDEAAHRRAAEIRTVVLSKIGTEIHQPGQPRFEFLKALSKAQGAPPATQPAAQESLRLIYSYCAVYGDPLLDPALDPYPDGLLEQLAAHGVNAVWLHTVLRDLAPSASFPGFGIGHEKRLANLRRLVERARRYGIRVVLYVNEPRAMPVRFFDQRPDLAGVREGDFVALCSSAPVVKKWITDSLAFVFEQVPDLGGVFTITGSENLTNCASHYQQAACPRCSKQSGARTIADVNAAIAEGVRRGNPKADVIAWDWGWPDDWAAEIIEHLPTGLRFMSVSEWSTPIERGGIKTEVGEYALSVVGPGPRAQRNWKLAQARGLRPMAKRQINASWELSAMPSLPVLDLVARHCENLARLGVQDSMFSWTVGGYPSVNLEVASSFAQHPDETAENVLQRVAAKYYGSQAAPEVGLAWSAFSRAFSEYPFHVALLYNGPMQCGPANPLYIKPTGYKATMVGFPYDDIDAWRGPYAPDALAGQLEKLVNGWADGMAYLYKAQAIAESRYQDQLDGDLRLAQAAKLHFQSVAAQVRFIVARNTLRPSSATPHAEYDQESSARSYARTEQRGAHDLYLLAKQDSRIGFEASNHYYYGPLDLVEKIVNCDYVLHELPK